MSKTNFLACSCLGTILCVALVIPLQAKSAEPKVDGIPLLCISEAEKLKDSLYFARTYAAIGEKQKALALLTHAEKQGHLMEDEYVFLKEIASIYLKLGDKDKALEFLKTLQATRPKTPKEILFKDTVLLAIADDYAQAKEYTQALQDKNVTNNILMPDFIMRSYIFLEKYDKALQIAKSLPPERRDRWIEPLTCASRLSISHTIRR